MKAIARHGGPSELAYSRQKPGDIALPAKNIGDAIRGMRSCRSSSEQALDVHCADRVGARNSG